ncbi:lamin tail domain-containing protein [Kibdelosporangium phytohabitans]|uniref:LTD domain-containing protein n=1 Tax=Kibdelosporangium phytohabitans TaxID=860235 RepID=A0A0N9HSI6_9PSEU|nr:lamin tail domain-containing protein [Kibdelosporangium phytohabitans]ALG10200.1 hypothetical protein AOZ06_27870 [Kibdelosporangium phytohabitans]MBE1461217.1 putative extracellular nuclease [Kibdelosporangium phytohabitans]
MRRFLLGAAMAAVAVTPAIAGAATADEPAVTASSTVVVNEVSTRGPANALDEFIELRNITSQPQDISGWQIRIYGPNNFVVDTITVFEGTVLSPRDNLGQFLVVQGTNLTAPITDNTNVQLYTPSSTVGVPSNGGVAIFNQSGVKVDGISFANPVTTPREGQPAVQQTPAMDQLEPSSARDILSTDTDNNRVDFTLHKRTPGALN